MKLSIETEKTEEVIFGLMFGYDPSTKEVASGFALFKYSLIITIKFKR